MKHSIHITVWLLLIFVISQVVGLFIINAYIPKDGVVNDLPLNIERPEVNQTFSFTFIFSAIIFGTILFLILIKFKTFLLWKIWFAIAVFMTLTISFFPWLGKFAGWLAIVLAFFKIFKPNVITHNITEVFMYGGLAAIFVPMLNLFSATILLILISLYDMFAVWQSKHMVKLAEFQKSAKVFAGIYLPYKSNMSKAPKKVKTKTKSAKTSAKVVRKTKQVTSAILGGGDIGFPLMFTGVLLPVFGFKVLVITATTTIALGLLFKFAKKDRYYPAMPFVSAGCFIGYGILLLL